MAWKKEKSGMTWVKTEMLRRYRKSSYTWKVDVDMNMTMITVKKMAHDERDK